MKCPDPEAWLAFYGGETDEAATARMTGHLLECRACQEEFDRLSRFGAGLRGALRSPGARPRAFRRRLVRPRAPVWLPLAVAAGLALTAVGLVLFTRSSRPSEAVPIARAPDVVAGPPPQTPPLPVPPPVRTPLPPLELHPKGERSPSVPPAPAPEEPAPAPPEPPPPAPAPAPPGQTRASATSVAIAILERLEGSRPLLEGQGAQGRGIVKFPDGTRMELGEKTVLARISDRAGAGGIGKWVDLVGGTLTVEAAHQPVDRAMAVTTPQGEARIVGTTLRLAVEKDSTRLEVVEGRVRLSRPGSGETDVIGGHFAVAAEGVELAARPLPKMVSETLLQFTFEDGRMPRGVEAGAVERGPERPGSRFCVAGAMIPGGTSGGHVRLASDDPKGLFAYADDLVLSFDYWADDSVRTLDLHMWSRLQQTTFGLTVWNTARERWAHQVIPLGDFMRTEPDRLLRMKPGEAVPYIWIQAGQAGGKLYLDNLEVVRLRPPQAKKK